MQGCKQIGALRIPVSFVFFTKPISFRIEILLSPVAASPVCATTAIVCSTPKND